MRNALAMLGVLAIFAIVSPAKAAVGRPDTAAVQPTDTAKTTVEVNNQAYLDADVYLVKDGVSTRLGIATGSMTTTFTVPAYLSRGLSSVRFVIHPIGGLGNSTSEEMMVSPGDHLELTIPPF